MKRLSIIKLFKLSSIYGIAPVIDKIVGFAMIPVLTHYLDPHKYGSLMVLYASAYVVGLVVTMGCADSMTKIYWDYNDHDRNEFFGTIWLTIMLLYVVFGAPIIIFSKYIAVSLFENVNVFPLIILLIIKLVFSAQAMIPTISFRAKQMKNHVLAVNLINISTRVMLTLLFLIYYKLDLVGIFIAEICANMACLVIYVPELIKVCRLNYHVKYLAKLFTLAPYEFFMALLIWVIELSDRLLIQKLGCSTSDIGVYSIAFAFGGILIIVFNSINIAWRPYVYELNTRSQQEYDVEMSRILTLLIGISTLLYLTIGLMSSDVITIITPKFYHPAGSLVPIILLGINFKCLSAYLLPNYYIEGKMRLVMILYIISATVKLFLNFTLIPWLGIMGAAWSICVSYALMFMMILISSQKIRRLQIQYRTMGIILGSAVLAWWVIGKIKTPNPFIDIASKAALISLYLFPFTFWYYKRQMYMKKLQSTNLGNT